MNKNTLFFSHSSKDKNLILPIKDKIKDITGNVFDIFMSSDGQSIPFGRNWLHKVETGLQEAKIMFVFVTETSLSSGWIYFEAGFAYSKGIQVIPVGIGVDIGELKAPLNMLQGFNITSGDSLNNFISIINDLFNYNFKEEFIDDDYQKLINIILNENNQNTSKCDLEQIVQYIEYEICPTLNHYDKQKRIVSEDIKNILKYFEDNNILFSKQSNSRQSCKDFTLIVCGIKITYHKGDMHDGGIIRLEPDEDYIKFCISPYNFEKSFDLLKNILKFIDIEKAYIKLHFKYPYQCVSSPENISALVSKISDIKAVEENIRQYNYQPLKLKFSIFDDNYNNKESEYVATIGFECSDCSTENIFKLINELMSVNVIYYDDNLNLH